MEPEGEALLIAMPYPPGAGYAWNYIEAVARGLAQRSQDRGIRPYIAHPNLPAGTAPTINGVGYVVADFYSARAADRWQCGALLRRLRVRTLYFAEHPPFGFAFVLYRVAGVRRIVVHIHHAGGARTAPRGIARWLRQARAAVPGIKADLACCVSEFVAGRVVDASLFPSERTCVVPNAMYSPSIHLPSEDPPELEASYKAAATGRPLILCCSRASTEKGVDLLLQAFDLVWNARREAGASLPVLLYCGDGPDLPSFRSLREQLAARESIFLPGKVHGAGGPLSHAAVAVHYARCEEAFGLFALEAMSYGIPVIVSDRGALPEIVIDGVTGMVIPAEDVGALSKAITACLYNVETAKSLGAAARRRVSEHFEFEQMLDQLVACVVRRSAD